MLQASALPVTNKLSHVRCLFAEDILQHQFTQIKIVKNQFNSTQCVMLHVVALYIMQTWRCNLEVTECFVENILQSRSYVFVRAGFC